MNTKYNNKYNNKYKKNLMYQIIDKQQKFIILQEILIKVKKYWKI